MLLGDKVHQTSLRGFAHFRSQAGNPHMHHTVKHISCYKARYSENLTRPCSCRFAVQLLFLALSLRFFFYICIDLMTSNFLLASSSTSTCFWSAAPIKWKMCVHCAAEVAYYWPIVLLLVNGRHDIVTVATNVNVSNNMVSCMAQRTEVQCLVTSGWSTDSINPDPRGPWPQSYNHVRPYAFGLSLSHTVTIFRPYCPRFKKSW